MDYLGTVIYLLSQFNCPSGSGGWRGVRSASLAAGRRQRVLRLSFKCLLPGISMYIGGLTRDNIKIKQNYVWVAMLLLSIKLPLSGYAISSPPSDQFLLPVHSCALCIWTIYGINMKLQCKQNSAWVVMLRLSIECLLPGMKSGACLKTVTSLRLRRSWGLTLRFARIAQPRVSPNFEPARPVHSRHIVCAHTVSFFLTTLLFRIFGRGCPFRFKRLFLLLPSILFTDGLYTKGARAHTHRELIREWLWYSHGEWLWYSHVLM